MDGEDIFLSLTGQNFVPQPYAIRKSMVTFPTRGYAHYLTQYFP